MPRRPKFQDIPRRRKFGPKLDDKKKKRDQDLDLKENTQDQLVHLIL